MWYKSGNAMLRWIFFFRCPNQTIRVESGLNDSITMFTIPVPAFHFCCGWILTEFSFWTLVKTARNSIFLYPTQDTKDVAPNYFISTNLSQKQAWKSRNKSGIYLTLPYMSLYFFLILQKSYSINFSSNSI